MSGSLATIVQQYKASVTWQIRRRFGGNARLWQRNYHEHIIRNEEDWSRLHLYVEANAMNWADDEENANRVRI